jgi:hypothetical protein
MEDEFKQDILLEQKKLILGIQLIAEASDAAIKGNNISGRNKMLLNNMRIRCLEFEKDLYDNLNEEGRKVYESLLSDIEKLLNNTL